ncbi:hypothetical protein CC78DRAFT_539326 [Lojkania enalia]|uniref:Uncharacterized protein n=1 Tax=Lojkania enalia TaxID=147567 RepID=A0A9P4NBC5_9PLEO|nr:hypothetical protein CC78DRAFT_539326 [Didymosphaeria enalia]
MGGRPGQARTDLASKASKAFTAADSGQRGHRGPGQQQPQQLAVRCVDPGAWRGDVWTAPLSLDDDEDDRGRGGMGVGRFLAPRFAWTPVLQPAAEEKEQGEATDSTCYRTVQCQTRRLACVGALPCSASLSSAAGGMVHHVVRCLRWIFVRSAEKAQGPG